MLIVGARRQTAFLALVSAARSLPASWVSSLEKAAPTAVEFGRAEAGAETGSQLLVCLNSR